ncbi:MAG: class I SAM-dependent methyltransferase [Candidatus Pacebacteria bacterium]|nr:class I SAM-dependent methyltransferase [Candidatus Paceibacterota bacterium]
MEYQKQVDKKHYAFEKYVDQSRWMSYWHQIREIVSRPEISSVLEIGPGSDFLRQVLRVYRPDITYHTVDIATDLQPDIVGNATKIPVEANSYDLVCAFQVLEHIEYSDFEPAIIEMKRVAKEYVFISLPHFSPSIEFWFKIPFLKRLKLATKIPVPLKHTFGGQHYWEIGKKGYSPKKIRSVLQKHLTILDEYVPFENQYHRFYITKIS